MINHQHPRAAAQVGGQPDFARVVVDVLGVEQPVPFLDELRTVLELVALVRSGLVGASRRPLEVDHVRPGFVRDAQSSAARLEAQVRVLVIHRIEALVKAANLPPEISPDHQRGGRRVIDLSAVLVVAAGGIVAAPVVRPRSVTPDDPTRLCERPVGI